MITAAADLTALTNADEKKAALAVLRRAFNAEAPAMPAYNVKRFDEMLKAEEANLRGPPRRFGLSNTILAKKPIIEQPVERVHTLDTYAPTTTSYQLIQGIAGSETLSLCGYEHCVIDLRHVKTVFQVAHLNKLTKCLVLFPPISQSVMVHNCRDCTMLITAHQIRIHDSVNCTLYSQTSSLIMEGCDSCFCEQLKDGPTDSTQRRSVFNFDNPSKEIPIGNKHVSDDVFKFDPEDLGHPAEIAEFLDKVLPPQLAKPNITSSSLLGS